MLCTILSKEGAIFVLIKSQQSNNWHIKLKWRNKVQLWSTSMNYRNVRTFQRDQMFFETWSYFWFLFVVYRFVKANLLDIFLFHVKHCYCLTFKFLKLYNFMCLNYTFVRQYIVHLSLYYVYSISRRTVLRPGCVVPVVLYIEDFSVVFEDAQ